MIIVSGKGGVGKSAVTAAIVGAAHRSGARVLAVAMGEPAGLAAHLGRPSLPSEITELRDGLSAVSIDRSRALAEYLEVQVGLPSIVAFGPALRAFDALASAAPGVREIVTIGKVLWEVRRGDWDVIVADAPPTGQIGSYLRASRTITELVPAGKIRDQAGWMAEILADPGRCRLLLTTLAEELPTAETVETLQWLAEEDLVGSVEVVTNRVLPTPEFDVDGLPGGRAGDAARLHCELVEEQRRWLEALPPDRDLPFLFGVMTPAEVAALLADEVEGWESAS